MYINFKNGKSKSRIKNLEQTKDSQNIFYLFKKNMFFGRRYEDFMVIVNNLGFLIKEMDLDQTFKERLLKIIYLLNDVSHLKANEDLDGEELIADMLEKLQNCKYGTNEYELSLTLQKIEGYKLTTEEHQSYIDYNKLSFDKMLETPEPIDLNRLNYIIENDELIAYTDINSRCNFWAISLLDAETTNYNCELYKNLKDMLFEIGNLSRTDRLVYDKEGYIMYTEMTVFSLHKETIHAVNQLLNALRYALNCHSFKTNELLYYDLNKIDNHIEFFCAMMNNSYRIAASQYSKRNSV